MKTVAIEDEETQLSALIDDAERGECVTITRGGRPVAQIVPMEMPPGRRRAEAVEAMLEFGRQHRGALQGLSIRELIDEGRRH